MSAYSTRVIADGASYYWRLGETSGLTAVDAVGGANGTISGGVTLGGVGAIGDGNKAMTFDGTTGSIVTAAVTVPVVSTIEAWIKTSVDGFRYHLAIGGISIGIGESSGTKPFLYDGTTHYGTRILDDGQWHALVWVFAGATVTVYVDGVADGTSAQFLAAPVTGALSFSPNTGFWLGALDDIAIYPRALTAPEIAAHVTLSKQAAHWPGVPWWTQVGGGEDALDSYNVWEPITPSDTVNLPRGAAGGIWVGGGGDVAAVMGNNIMPVVLAAVPTGAWLPLAAKRINATGTTATGLVALYEV